MKRRFAKNLSEIECNYVFFYLGFEMSSDDRSWLMQTVLGMDIASTVSYFYPRLIPVVSNFY